MRREAEDDVVANRAQFRRLAGCQPMGQHDGMLRGRHFTRVQTAVDPHDGAALACQGLRLVGSDPLDECKPPRDVAIAVQPGEYLFRRDDRHEHVVAVGGLTGHGHPELNPAASRARYLVQLTKIGKLVVAAGFEAEHLARCRHVQWCRLCSCSWPDELHAKEQRDDERRAPARQHVRTWQKVPGRVWRLGEPEDRHQSSVKNIGRVRTSEPLSVTDWARPRTLLRRPSIQRLGVAKGVTTFSRTADFCSNGPARRLPGPRLCKQLDDETIGGGTESHT